MIMIQLLARNMSLFQEMIQLLKGINQNHTLNIILLHRHNHCYNSLSLMYQ